MGTALGIVDIIAKAKNVFMKFIGILKCHLYLNTFTLTLEVDHVMQHLNIIVEVLHKTNYSVRFMELHMLHLRLSAILINNRQCRI